MMLVRPTDVASMAQLVEELRAADPTFPDAGATLSGARPAGFRCDQEGTVVGRGGDTFQRAVHGLRSWEAHRLSGIRVVGETEIQSGATVVVTLGTPVVALAAPCRIVEVIDEPARWGFAYATLPGHPEQGEESFVVSIEDDETVDFEITALSRPASRMVRLSGPLGRGLQRSGMKGYLRALRRFVDGRE
jgi:uncharacterized protein (UPF0548 family)